MIRGPWRVKDECVNQDTGRRLKEGDTIEELSAGEYGRLTAFNYIEFDSDGAYERNEGMKKKSGIKIKIPVKTGKKSETAMEKRPVEKRTK